MGNIMEIARGGSPRPIQNYITTEDNGLNWIKIGDTDKGGKYISSTKEKIKPEGLKKTRFVHKGDFLLTNSMSFGRPYILNIDGCIHDGWLVISDKFKAFSVDFLYYLISSSFAYNQFCGKVSGAVVSNLNSEKVSSSIFPLPPLSEQERIVKKIEELEPFIEEYGKAEVELTTLNNNFPEQIKKSILQYAIQGKLVEQDPNDEPASVLLEKIKAEKQELIKQGKIKKDKQESYIFKGADNRHYEKIGSETKDITDEIPFQIPNSWEWVRLGSVSKYIQRGKSPKYSEIMKIPVISQKCNKWEIFDIKQAKFIQEDSLSSYSEDRLLIDGDILWNSTGTGTVGRLAIYYDKLNPYKIAVADSHVTVIRLCSINSQYIYYYLSSPQVQIGIEDICDGSTNQKELSLTTVKEYLIPIPPLKEQERIVAKIEQIKKYIENL